MPILRQRSKKLLYAGLAGAGVMSLVLSSGFYYLQSERSNRQALETEQYQQHIQSLEAAQLDEMESMKSAWVPLRDIPAGHFIESGDLQEVRLPVNVSPDNLPAHIEEVTGKGVKIELRKGTPITLGMLFAEEATPRDLRNREMKSIWLPSNLKKDDVVDIRIQFPTGQDYIVLSKKRIDKLSSPAFWTTLNEQEILLFSSAMVDAYLHEASIYALTYVEPELQERAVPNYPPNHEVIKLIKNDPNIVKKAESQLEASIRTLLDQDLSRLNQDKSMQSSSGNGFNYAREERRMYDWNSVNGLTNGSAVNEGYLPEQSSGSWSIDETETDKKDRLTEASDILGGQGIEDNNVNGGTPTDDEMEAIFTSP
ncbi:SAF domain-containing protein [Paenibacillus dakarensis]|uniref:SAF domain-containing protein n=1 Tax=Paenibacillus dakarensis TaxID=1527293 RepID=UPI0006D57032|nr:SAF domain-containing protein [Paenibacillus dakarensis]